LARQTVYPFGGGKGVTAQKTVPEEKGRGGKEQSRRGGENVPFAGKKKDPSTERNPINTWGRKGTFGKKRLQNHKKAAVFLGKKRAGPACKEGFRDALRPSLKSST